MPAYPSFPTGIPTPVYPETMDTLPQNRGPHPRKEAIISPPRLLAPGDLPGKQAMVSDWVSQKAKMSSHAS